MTHTIEDSTRRLDDGSRLGQVHGHGAEIVLDAFHQSLPESFQRIEFWAMGGQEEEEHAAIRPQEVKQPLRLLVLVDACLVDHEDVAMEKKSLAERARDGVDEVARVDRPRMNVVVHGTHARIDARKPDHCVGAGVHVRGFKQSGQRIRASSFVAHKLGTVQALFATKLEAPRVDAADQVLILEIAKSVLGAVLAAHRVT